MGTLLVEGIDFAMIGRLDRGKRVHSYSVKIDHRLGPQITKKYYE